MEINFPAYGLQISNIRAIQKPTSIRSCSSLSTSFGCYRHLIFGLAYPSNLFHSKKLQVERLKVSCVESFQHFSEEEFSKRMEEMAQLVIGVTDYYFDYSGNESFYTGYENHDNWRFRGGRNSVGRGFLSQFLPSKLEYLESHQFGVQLNLPNWPERNEIASIAIENKANSVGIPLSLRMIKRKQKWQDRLVDAGDYAGCSVKKAFSSMVFMIRELQRYALEIRESLYCEGLHEVMNKVQNEMNSSFVWMFRQVFSTTPTLMVYVMILLANFTVNSMAENVHLDALPLSGVVYATILEAQEHHVSDSIASVDTLKDESLHPEMTAEELGLWKKVLEETLRIQEDSSSYMVMDRNIMQQLVAPVTVELEPDECEQNSRTNLLYQMDIAREPDNVLLLLKYAQFLCNWNKDFDSAEECYKLAVQIEPPDAEALSQYADFLWKVRNDLWGAEERYQQAISADPENSYHISKYVKFLCSTGGEEICYPLS